MAGIKEIRSKIASIKQTKKITKAMEMVAVGKMRRARDTKEKSEPYAKKMLQVIDHLAKSRPEYQHSYLFERQDVKRVGYIVITSDRSLCGGLNINLLKMIVGDMRQWHEKHAEIDLCLIGSKALSFFKRYGGNILAHADHLGDRPSLEDLIGIVKIMLDAYDEGKIDRLTIAHNEFINTMTQKPTLFQLLPLAKSEHETHETKSGVYWDYIYEPDAKYLLDIVLRRYIESQVYQSVVENIACEQAARMVAMKSASDNAADLISDLQLIYNKARQAAITRELSEIVAGAAAVSE